MSTFPEKLVFDGGFATEIVSNGFHIDGDPLWSARMLYVNQDAITKVHKSFLLAGADVILSATYQASIDGFKNHLSCTKEQAEELIRSGGRLAIQARDSFWEEFCKNKATDKDHRIKPFTCGSLGPYGAYLSDASEYTGAYVDNMSIQELTDWHRSRLLLLSAEELDFYLFETIPAMKEAKAISNLIEEFPTFKFIVSFSCKDGTHVCHGEKLSEVVKILNPLNQVVAVGINCTSPQYITPLLKSIKEVNKKNLLIMPNSGELWENKRWNANTEWKPLKTFLNEWISNGALWIGGCCRTTPEDVTIIRKALLED